MNRKKRIFFICQDLDAGGSEEALASVIKKIDREKYEIALCCIKKRGVIGQEFADSGFYVICLNAGYSFFDIFTILKIYRAIKKFKPDVVHTSLFYANFHGRISAKLAGVPVILSEEQNICEWKSKRPVFIIADKILSLFTDKIIACSQTVKDFTAKQENLSPDKIIVVHNTFDKEKFDLDNTDNSRFRREIGLNNTDAVIGTIGRLCGQKGQKYLIEAMAGVSGKNPGAKLLILGEGPFEDSLKKLALEYGLSDRVFFMGKRRDIPALLKIFDVFVLPSLWEGLSVVLLEAMYMAKPIVATDIPSNREVMIDRDTGLLVKAADAVSLAGGINFLLNNRSAAETFGMNARKRALEYFSPDRRARKLTDLYDSLI